MPPPRVAHEDRPFRRMLRCMLRCAVCRGVCRGQKVCLQRDEVLEELAVDELRLRYVQVRGEQGRRGRPGCLPSSNTGLRAKTLNPKP